MLFIQQAGRRTPLLTVRSFPPFWLPPTVLSSEPRLQLFRRRTFCGVASGSLSHFQFPHGTSPSVCEHLHECLRDPEGSFSFFFFQ